MFIKTGIKKNKKQEIYLPFQLVGGALDGFMVATWLHSVYFSTGAISRAESQTHTHTVLTMALLKTKSPS